MNNNNDRNERMRSIMRRNEKCVVTSSRCTDEQDDQTEICMLQFLEPVLEMDSESAENS